MEQDPGEGQIGHEDDDPDDQQDHQTPGHRPDDPEGHGDEYDQKEDSHGSTTGQAALARRAGFEFEAVVLEERPLFFG